MGVVNLHLAQVLQVQLGVVFVNSVYCCKVIHIQEIKPRLQQIVNWVIIVQ